MNKSLDFDPALRELLFRTTGKPAGELIPEHIAAREIPVVARLNATEAVIPNLRVVTRFGQIVTGRAPLGQVIELRNHPQIVSLKASLSFGPSLHRSVSHIHAHPEQLPRRTSGQLSGRGVIVGVIDWGCDFGHSNFRNSDGTTRLVAIWDQRPGPSPSSPAPYRYGRVMERDAIDAALMQGDPYRALGYHPSDVDFDGTGTHGTHILDIAAGNGRAPGSAAGVAPGADLLFVHLRGDDTLPQETLGDSVRLLEAVRWVLDRAGARPVVLNLSLGRTGGPHDGTTLVERALDAAVEEQAGRAIVMSTGNYFSAGMHSSGRLRSGQKTDLRFRLPRERRGVTELEIWYSGQDEFAAE
ncbi:MAG: S8 family serine peptidase, partial [Myxococcota bacterium]